MTSGGSKSNSSPFRNALLKVMQLTHARMPLTAASPMIIATEHTIRMPVIAIASVAISRKSYPIVSGEIF